MRNNRGSGEFCTFAVSRRGRSLRRPATGWTPNTWLYGWGEIATQTIVRGDARYKLGAMYIEFENVGSPETAVSVPTVNREDGISYYNNLSSSGNRDFLRVPLELEPSLSVVPGTEDLLDPGHRNRAVLTAQTVGSVGVHGKTFSNAANSKVFGIAVAATPDFGDRTQDIVYARAYHDVANQTVKPASSQVSVLYRLEFT